MDTKPECTSCGAEPTDEVRAVACEACTPLVEAALAMLRPGKVVEPNGLSPERRGALRRVREIGRWAAEVTLQLAREDLDDEKLRPVMEHANSWWAESRHLRDHRLQQRNEVMALLFELGGKLRRKEVTEDGALVSFARCVIERWPELERIDGDPVREALRAVAGGRPRGDQWPAAGKLLKDLGLVTSLADEKSIREQIYHWLDTYPDQLRELVGSKRRAKL